METTTVVAIAGLCSAVAGAVGSLLTVFFTKGPEAWRIVKKTKAEIGMEERRYQDSEAKKAYDILIEQYGKIQERESSELSEVKTELKEVKVQLDVVKADRTECLVGQESLRGDIKLLNALVARLQKHDEATEAQILVNKLALVKAGIIKDVNDPLPTSGRYSVQAIELLHKVESAEKDFGESQRAT